MSPPEHKLAKTRDCHFSYSVSDLELLEKYTRSLELWVVVVIWLEKILLFHVTEYCHHFCVCTKNILLKRLHSFRYVTSPGRASSTLGWWMFKGCRSWQQQLKEGSVSAHSLRDYSPLQWGRCGIRSTGQLVTWCPQSRIGERCMLVLSLPVLFSLRP